MSFVPELEKLLGVSLITDPDITSSYSKDQAPFAPFAPAKAVLLATTFVRLLVRAAELYLWCPVIL